MNKKTKFSKLVNEKIDSSKTYTIDEAVSIIMEFKRASFVESVDVAYNLGVDPKHADQNIRLNSNYLKSKNRYILNSEFFKQTGDQSTDYFERMWDPIIMYRGDLAVAWTTYDFHLNGKFSHCGAESFTLTRVDNRWMVMDWAYTANELENCNSPLGPIEK